MKDQLPILGHNNPDFNFKGKGPKTANYGPEFPSSACIKIC